MKTRHISFKPKSQQDFQYLVGRMANRYFYCPEKGLLKVLQAADNRKQLVYVEYLDSLGCVDSIKFTDINFNHPKLGFVNVGETYSTVSLMKHQSRQWKWGLDFQKCSVLPLKRNGGNKFYSLNDVKQSLIGNFPRYEQCLDRVEDIFDGQAFCRSFAVDEHYNLRHTSTSKSHVGVINGDNGNVKLDKKFHYLKEELQEELATSYGRNKANTPEVKV